MEFEIRERVIVMDEAVKKLRAEIEANVKDDYVKVIGEFLLQHIQSNPSDADNITAADKTIAKSLDAMCEVARKKQRNGRAMLTDEEGFRIVLKYFGIESKPDRAQGNFANPEKQQSVSTDPPKTATGFNVSLDDLLGGM